jgi:glutathione synthase/RimK-type ligase-like ATP-grasp enzyme
MKPTILLLSYQQDPHVQYVAELLDAQHLPYAIFDPASFPQRATLSAWMAGETDGWAGTLRCQDRTIELASIRSIWYRRPSPCQVPATWQPSIRAFAQAEAEAGLGGVLRCLEGVWVNHPERNRLASYKARQLHLAQRLGLRVPRTLLTNDPEQARAFYAECSGQVVYKVLRDGMIDLGDGHLGSIYTSVVTETSLSALERVRSTCHQFQEWLPKALELRITIFGTQVFAAEIHSQQAESTRLDWRRDYRALRYARHTLPASVEQACLDLLKTYSLQFGAIDMILTPAGEYSFLELNANGQWGWLEPVTGWPMRQALIDLLTGNAEALS